MGDTTMLRALLSWHACGVRMSKPALSSTRLTGGGVLKPGPCADLSSPLLAGARELSGTK